MTILTIDEAAKFLRLSRRSLYRLKDMPRVRYAGKLVYVQEDLEAWVRSHMDSLGIAVTRQDIEVSRRVRHHRNPLFNLSGDRMAR
jgi:predicted DNA-binding transcriptional regulator AlpA